MTKLGIVAGAFVAVGVVAALLERQAQSELRKQNQALQQKIEQLAQAGAPSQPVAGPANRSPAPAGGQSVELLKLRGEFGRRRQEKAELGQLQADNRRLRSKLFEQLLAGKKLSAAQVAPYLAAQQRNAGSLVAACRLTGDETLLQEALAKHPDDPRVNFAACFAGRQKPGSTPEESRRRLEALKQSAPDNALANCLSAQAYFKAGQPELAAQELAAAAGKPQFQDYSGDFAQSAEEAYLAAGLSAIEAKMAATTLPLPQLAELRGLGESVAKLASQYRQAGDEASAQAALQMGAALGRRAAEPSGQDSLIRNLVGIAIESKNLGALAPASPYGGGGQTVKDRLDELARQRQAIKDIARDGSDSVLQSLSEQDQLGYFDRLKTAGEAAALRWAASRQGGR